MPDTLTDSLTLTALIASKMEPNHPVDGILQYFRENRGKGWSTRHLDKLRLFVQNDSLRIHQIASMTMIEWGGYGNRGMAWGFPYDGPDHGGSLLIAYAIKGIVIDPDYLLKYNSAYFSARDERNAQRVAVLANPKLLDKAQTLINQRLAYLAEIDKIDARLSALTAYGCPLAADRYDIEKLAGIK